MRIPRGIIHLLNTYSGTLPEFGSEQEIDWTDRTTYKLIGCWLYNLQDSRYFMDLVGNNDGIGTDITKSFHDQYGSQAVNNDVNNDGGIYLGDIDPTNPLNLGSANEFTLYTFMQDKVEAVNNPRFLYKGDGSPALNGFSIHGDVVNGQLRLSIGSNGVASPTTDLFKYDDWWRSFSVSFSGTEVKYYADGTLVDTVAHTDTISSAETAAYLLNWADHAAANGRGTNNPTFITLLWDRVLYDYEITDLRADSYRFLQPASRFRGQKPLSPNSLNSLPINRGLVGCWMFDEGSGSTYNDLVGNGDATGNVVTMPWTTQGSHGYAIDGDLYQSDRGAIGLVSNDLALKGKTEFSFYAVIIDGTGNIGGTYPGVYPVILDKGSTSGGVASNGFAIGNINGMLEVWTVGSQRFTSSAGMFTASGDVVGFGFAAKSGLQRFYKNGLIHGLNDSAVFTLPNLNETMFILGPGDYVLSGAGGSTWRDKTFLIKIWDRFLDGAEMLSVDRDRYKMVLPDIVYPLPPDPPVPPPTSRIDWTNPDTDGLVGAWVFDEGGGSDFIDLCENNDGVAVGTVNRVTDATFGDGVHLDSYGTSSKISLGSIAPGNVLHFADTNALSIAFAVKQDARDGRYPRVIAKSTGGFATGGWGLYPDNNRLQFAVSGANVVGTNNTLTTDGTIKNFMVSISSGDNDVFRDGVRRGGSASTFTIPSDTVDAALLNHGSTTDRGWDVPLYYVYVWNKKVPDSVAANLEADPYAFILPPP